MTLDKDKIAGLNVALNEATLIALDFEVVRRRASVTLELLSLPPTETATVKRAVELLLFPIGRLLVSLSEEGTAGKVTIQTVSALVESFRGQAIYGWEFIDPPNLDMARLQNPLSLDYRTGEVVGSTHVIHLFQDSKGRQLDILMWFDDLCVKGIDGPEIAVEEVIAGGKRYWDAVFAGDSRTREGGIEPLQ